MLILGINGSPHKGGMCDRLLAQALQGSLHEGAEVDYLHLVDHIRTFPDGELSDRIPPELEELILRIEAADGIIVATPVHWFNVSALTKALIDFLSATEYRGFSLEGKALGALASCEEDGGAQALSLIALPLLHLGFLIPPYSLVFHNRNMADKSEDRWQERDPWLVGANVVRLARLAGKRGWNDGR